MRRAWFLNFDAEEELARPQGYTPSAAMRERSRDLSKHVSALLGPGDVVISDDTTALDSSYESRAWCPTPRANRAFQKACVRIAPAPDFATIRRVNHRRFCADLGQCLPGATFAASEADVRAALASTPEHEHWLLKRPYGYAGRGRMKVTPLMRGDLDRVESWIRASFRIGDGLQVEPLVNRRADFALHGYIGRHGEVIWGEITEQVCDDSGAWNSTHRADETALGAEEATALRTEATRAAVALKTAGYWGPFGVDAYRYLDAEGCPRFHPRGEINARYSMGWPVGMGDRRPDLESLL